MLKRITILLIGVIAFSGCSTKYKIIHEPLEIKDPCEFSKFTEAEKSSMTEAVGIRIDENQNNCYENAKANQKRVDTHNKLHQ